MRVVSTFHLSLSNTIPLSCGIWSRYSRLNGTGSFFLLLLHLVALSSLFTHCSFYFLSSVGALHASTLLPSAACVSGHNLLLCSLFSIWGWSLMVLLPWGSSLSIGSLSGAGFVTTPMKRGTREASSTRAKRKGELTEKMETERIEVITVVADASTPASLSSTVLAWRTLLTFRGMSDIPERSGAENREPRPDFDRRGGLGYRLKGPIDF